MTLDKGVLMIAHNNVEIDYGQMALINALMVKKNMNVPVCLITDKGTIQWLRQNHPDTTIDYAFDELIYVDIPHTEQNIRSYKDSSFTIKKLQYNNGNRIDAFSLTPYKETLLLDTDFLILNDSLNKVWGSNSDFMMNKRIATFSDQANFFDNERLSKTGIPQYWATSVYFRKTPFTQHFFELCQHIKDNYDFYKFMYGFTGNLYRNDFVCSIALHVLNGFVETDEFDLPNQELFFTSDVDVLVDVLEENKLLFLIEKENERGNYYPLRCNRNVHVMNKYSVNRFAKKFIDIYLPKEYR